MQSLIKVMLLLDFFITPYKSSSLIIQGNLILGNLIQGNLI